MINYIILLPPILAHSVAIKDQISGKVKNIRKYADVLKKTYWRDKSKKRMRK